jgi:acyl-CoA synthetase (AMP-forming)/AMP-acid ligase II
MHPRQHALAQPDRPAIVMAGSGETVSFGELERRSNQAAHLLRARGLAVGDTIGILLENDPRYLEIAWAAQKAGLYFVCLSSKLTAAEAGYIVSDSGARLVVTSAAAAPVGLADVLPGIDLYMLGASVPPFRDWVAESGGQPDHPIADERSGSDMLYSSGTTGRPKGIRPALPEDRDIAVPGPLDGLGTMLGFGADTVYLCPAPLYHAAPLRWVMMTQRLGGTVILMERFDPAEALRAIERHAVTHAQWVPTHFVRMLKLPEDQRTAFDLSSLRLAVHAAAPCPQAVKQAMIAWWGPILVEYYAGTEGNGLTLIPSREWLTHPGSVGRAAVGTLHICDETGEPLPPRREGLVYFADGPAFTYHNDPGKTAANRNRFGWTTLGDIGWMDEEGYLYLTDRQSFMIISGGVNIYPQEIENLLVTHPGILDAAVIGVPDPEMGEKVVAVLQLVRPEEAGETFAAAITDWLRQSLSGVKVPRRIDFVDELPRHATGKLYKRVLRDRYRQAAEPATA